MPILPAPALEENHALRSLGLDAYPSSTGEVLSATAQDAWTRNPLPSLLRANNRLQTELQDEFSANPTPKLSPDEANLKFGIEGHLKFDTDTADSTAKSLYDLKRQELQRQDVFRRAQGGVAETVGSFMVGLGVSALDPLNVASAFIPVVGEARQALWAAKYGTTGGRFATGAVEGLVGATSVEPIVYGVAKQEQADYTATDSLLNLAFGTVLGGGFHAGLGKLGDLIQSRGLSEPALRGAVAAISEDRPVEVANSLKAELLRSSAFGDTSKVFDALLPAELKEPVRAGSPDETARLGLAERLNASSNEYADALKNLDQVNARVAQRANIAQASVKAETDTLVNAIKETETAHTEAKATLKEAEAKLETAKAALDKAKGRANTLRDSGIPPDDRKLVKAQEQADKAKGPHDAAVSEVERIKAEVETRKAKLAEQKDQLKNYRENRRAESPESAAKAQERFNQAEKAWNDVQAERDARLKRMRDEARTEFLGEIAQRQRGGLHISDKAEADAIQSIVSRDGAEKSGASDLASVKEDIDLMTASLKKMGDVIPEGELKALNEADEGIKQAEARAKAYESAAVCQMLRR